MNYLPLLKQSRPPAAESDLAQLENRFRSRFPKDYRAFLGQSNGGRFASNTVELKDLGDETVLNEMNRVGKDPDYSIEGDYDLFRMMDRIPKACIPIADDPGGNRFLISLEDDTHGAVFFWDHEYEPENGGDRIADFENMHRLAASFETFIAALK